MDNAIEIVRYSSQKESEWNEFVEKSKNGTFLFDRRYMDYHADRFADHSLLFYRDHELYAVLPANQKGHTFLTHQGLTYGGMVMGESATVSGICQCFNDLNHYLIDNAFQSVVYKAVPWIYHRQPSEEDLYALVNVVHAQLSVRHVSSTICLPNPINWRRDHRYGAHKSLSSGVVVSRSDDFEGFWKVLSDNLQLKYGAKPVHSLDEMRLLHSRFPNHIRLYTASLEGMVIGGTVVYLCGPTAHAQYISASPEGKKRHAIDAIFDLVLKHELAGYRFFDFGKSSDGDGEQLNTTLISQKEGYGARAVCYDWYQWKLQ